MLRLGVIGVGYFGKHYVRIINQIPEAVLSGVCDINENALERIVHLLPKDAKVFSDYRDILSNNNIDGVIIAVPASMHYRIVHDCMLSGKKVLVEKPLTDSYKDALVIESLVQKTECMIANTYLYNDYICFLQNVYTKGHLGEVSYAYIEWFNFGPIRSDVNCLWDLGSHGLSIIDYIFSPGDIVSVNGNSKTVGANKMEDFFSVNIEFENGLLVTLILSWLAPIKIRRATFVGDKAMAVFNDMNKENSLTLFEPGNVNCVSEYGATAEDFMTEASKKKVEPVYINAREPLYAQVEHFVETARKGKIPKSDILSGVRIVKWLDEISSAVKNNPS